MYYLELLLESSFKKSLFEGFDAIQRELVNEFQKASLFGF